MAERQVLVKSDITLGDTVGPYRTIPVTDILKLYNTALSGTIYYDSGSVNIFVPTTIPTASYVSATQYSYNASISTGFSNTCKIVLQDYKIRTFTGPQTFDMSTTGEGGRQANTAEAASKWYSINVVPKASNDSQLALIAHTGSASGGPAGYSNFKHIGWLRNDASSNLVNVIQYEPRKFGYATFTYITGMDATTLGTTEYPTPATTFDASNECPPTATCIDMKIQATWAKSGGSTQLIQAIYFVDSTGGQYVHNLNNGIIGRSQVSGFCPMTAARTFGYVCLDDAVGTSITSQWVQCFGWTDGAL